MQTILDRAEFRRSFATAIGIMCCCAGTHAAQALQDTSVASDTATNVVVSKTLEQAGRWRLDVALSTGPFSFEVDDRTFTVEGDAQDPGQAIIRISDRSESIVYRFWPNMDGWQLSEEWHARYAKEFEGIPGWRERTIRICIDADPVQRRVWIDGRLVTAWPVSDGAVFRLSAPSGTAVEECPAGMGEFLELDLGQYFNAGPESPFAPDAFVELDTSTGLCFESAAGEPHNIDLGELEYRSAHLGRGPYQGLSYPYVTCDAMSSDPRRAIFCVPARYYDRLHVLCYADDDAGEVPRAAFRFMQGQRVRFLTREFGIVPDEGVRVLNTVAVGDKRATHVVVDLNPAGFQEFVSETDNEYLEFELTQPVVMDANSFEHPAGPPSSLHVVAMALEEAPVTMSVTSAVPGHLFERPAEAVMHIRLKSNRATKQTGVVHVDMTMPDGERRRETIAFELAPLEEKVLEADVSAAPVGRSVFVAKLDVSNSADEKRAMERSTSFAMVPQFERKAEDSPFGMWSFFEGHLGADIETTCGILRKAGVRGTLTNFILGTEPSTWDENARRTETLRKYGIEPNWGYLAGIANSALDGLGDLDAKFAWVNAHPQVKHYNLFWETIVSRDAPRLCPPEIRGRAPRQWNPEELERIKTYMEFGKTWAARARTDAPDIELCFGSGFPTFTSAMLQAGFPKEYVDGLGLDFDMYTAAPEDQPSMWYAPFSGIYYLRELRKLYGFEDKPIWLTEAIYCPTSPIWITEREQADYYVRAHLLALAMGVERFGMCAEPIDPDGWYHYSHYGPVGLCHAPPELNPREAFCAYAAMTGVLDGAMFDTIVDLGSPHAYGLRFRKPDDQNVHAFWTVNGSRTLRLAFDDDATLYNRDGRDITVETIGRTRRSGRTSAAIRIDESPVYLVGPQEIDVKRLSETETVSPPEHTAILGRFDRLDDWESTGKPLAGYEEINDSTPIAWANLEMEIVDGALSIRPPSKIESHPLETLCMEVRYTGKPLLIDEKAVAIGVNARGDRSWGRIVFVLEDNAGNRWISAYSQTPVNVDGEIYLETELPKPPSTSEPGYRGYRPWRRDPGDVIPEYPMRLTGLVFELRTHAIYGPELMPLSDKGVAFESIVLRRSDD